MSVAGDQLETYATMSDGDGDPLTGLTITYLAFRDPDGDDLSTSSLDWEELDDGEYVVTFQTSTSSALGQYYLSFQFNDADESVWTENNWILTDATTTLYPVSSGILQTGTPQNVAPHRRDADDTHDSQYYLRGEEAVPGPHIHLTGGTLAAFGESDSIQLTQIGNTLYAVAKFGTTAASIAEGDALAAKLEESDVADVAMSGLYSDLLSIPSTFTPTAHNHSGTEITSGTIPVARLPTGITGSDVAWGNHSHTGLETWNIPIGAVGGGVIPTGTYVDIWVPYNILLVGEWFLGAMTTSGAIQLDLWVQDYASFPPVVANTIIGGGGTKPHITATGNKNKGDYTGWADTFLVRGQCLRINVDSRTAIEQVTLGLQHVRTIA